MSVQFGQWNFDGKPIDPASSDKILTVLEPFGPDGASSYSKENISICYRPFQTTKESHNEVQPHISRSGHVLTWDGRLDNRAELIGELRDLSINSTDVEIVAAAYEAWRTNCFARLIGDWALSVWDPRDHTLLLAKDVIGVRHLYYSLNPDRVVWSTLLDPLVRFADKTFAIDEEYIAGWFSFFPANHLTPFVGIHAVSPCSYVFLGPGKRLVRKYWDFEPGRRIRCGTDHEYEEQFRTLFGKAVQRRLRSDRPVLAELSGGIDSSCIVSVADRLIAQGIAEAPRLDTISWYGNPKQIDDDRPYFTKLEKHRGRVGFHIDLSSVPLMDSQDRLPPEFDDALFAPVPLPRPRHAYLFTRYASHMRTLGYRVVLSGQGGEEATAGSPLAPIPGLQDLLQSAQISSFVSELNSWGKLTTKPRSRLFAEVIRDFFRSFSPASASRYMHEATWFNCGFVRRNRAALSGYPERVRLIGPRPSFQHYMRSLNHVVRRAMAYFELPSDPLRDLRYPYLDRDLLEFMYAIPPGQLVRLGQSRSLLRRALAGIVPEEILNRTKPAVRRFHANQLVPWPTSLSSDCSLSSSIGVIHQRRFALAMEKARHNKPLPVAQLRRAVTLEAWLRHLVHHGVLAARVKPLSLGFPGDPCPAATPRLGAKEYP
jgi:asparagine synthase (glutamine-hydrolysing)